MTNRAVAGLILIGSLGSILSTLFFTLSACYADYYVNDEKAIFTTMKRNLIATVVQFLNGKILMHYCDTVGDSLPTYLTCPLL